MATDSRVLDWLLDSDPALRWQVERDLAGAPPETWEATRARVATEGFGAGCSSKQDADGQWAGGAYFPAGYFGSAEASEPGQPWVATTWALKDLREWGVDAAVLDGDRREARREQPLGVRRPAVLGRRGRRLHQLLHARDRGVAGRRCVGARRMVPRPPPRRRRLELRGGGGRLDALVVPLDAQRRARHARLRADHRRHQRARGPARRRGVPARRGACCTGRARASPSGTSSRGSCIRTATATARSRRSITSATPRCSRARAPDPRLADAVEVVRAARQPDGTWLQTTPLAGRTWFDVDVRRVSRRAG